MSEPARRSRVACWRRPSEAKGVSGELRWGNRYAYFLGRRRGGGLLSYEKS